MHTFTYANVYVCVLGLILFASFLFASFLFASAGSWDFPDSETEKKPTQFVLDSSNNGKQRRVYEMVPGKFSVQNLSAYKASGYRFVFNQLPSYPFEGKTNIYSN